MNTDVKVEESPTWQRNFAHVVLNTVTQYTDLNLKVDVKKKKKKKALTVLNRVYI